jgi:hypothetical protein
MTGTARNMKVSWRSKEWVDFLAERVLPGMRVAAETGRLRGFNEGAFRNSRGQGTGNP